MNTHVMAKTIIKNNLIFSPLTTIIYDTLPPVQFQGELGSIFSIQLNPDPSGYMYCPFSSNIPEVSAILDSFDGYLG